LQADANFWSVISYHPQIVALLLNGIVTARNGANWRSERSKAVEIGMPQTPSVVGIALVDTLVLMALGTGSVPCVRRCNILQAALPIPLYRP
jgi:hypothetical protein